MEIHLFMLIFVIGLITYILSTVRDKDDLSNTYQVQLAFLSMMVWVAMAFSSFNIETYIDATTIIHKVDYTFVGISWLFLALSFINILILFFYGSYNALFSKGLSR